MSKAAEANGSFSVVHRELDVLHPRHKASFKMLAQRLVVGHAEGKTHSLFLPFETYRDPHRQAILVARGASKAQPWSSPHNFGVAVDFVAKTNGQWSWDQGEDWLYLHDEARICGLSAPIAWDLCHVEPKDWSWANPYK